MKIPAIFFSTTQLQITFKHFFLFVFISCINNISSAQSTNLIGIEYGGMLIPKISSSGVHSSNYSFGIFSETEISNNWSIGYGLKYLKYGSHTYYDPLWGTALNGISEVLVSQQQYSIHNVGICITGKYRTKYAGVFVGIQPEKALFNGYTTTQRIIPLEDIRNENYPQNALRTFNVSLIGGFDFRRKFGERLEFFTKPSAQYFLKSFYNNEGFNDTRTAFHLTFGFNFILTVLAD